MCPQRAGLAAEWQGAGGAEVGPRHLRGHMAYGDVTLYSRQQGRLPLFKRGRYWIYWPTHQLISVAGSDQFKGIMSKISLNNG